MKINYTGADGRTLDLEVTDEVGTFYLESFEAEKRSDRRESRRHTSLETFSYEDARYFSDKSDMVSDFIESETIRHAGSGSPGARRSGRRPAPVACRLGTPDGGSVI